MKIYCSGIGGIGLSAYGAFAKSLGHEVSGSDRTPSAITDDLAAQGIEVFFNQDSSLLPSDIDLFVYSEAIPADAPERKKAAELGITQVSYFQALGELSKDYKVIAVCGSHGKSSTTAMAAKVLIEAEMDPSIVVGTKLKELNGRNWRKGGSDIFLLEACEYRRSFLHLYPDIIILTSVDGDHFDYYKDQADYENAYLEFINNLPAEGVVITHGNDDFCKKITVQINYTTINADGYSLPSLNTPGKHMQENGQLVLALADLLNLDREKTKESLKGYSGCWRRLELKGFYKDNVPVIDDYGHHPREVAATIMAVKKTYPDKRLVCVFQPHTHNRTRALYDQFLKAFNAADLLIIPNIYNARSDSETEMINVDQLVADIKKERGIEVINGSSLKETEILLRTSILKPGDVLLIMGAGDVTNLAAVMSGEKK